MTFWKSFCYYQLKKKNPRLLFFFPPFFFSFFKVFRLFISGLLQTLLVRHEILEMLTEKKYSFVFLFDPSFVRFVCFLIIILNNYKTSGGGQNLQFFFGGGVRGSEINRRTFRLISNLASTIINPFINFFFL